MMGLHVALQADLLRELLFADGAGETFLFAVDPHVLGETLLPRERFPTDGALEALLAGVDQRVVLQLQLRPALHAAARAGVALVGVRGPEVVIEALPLVERVPAFGAGVRGLGAAVGGDEVLLLALPRHEPLAALHAAELPAGLRASQVLALRLERGELPPALPAQRLRGVTASYVVFQRVVRQVALAAALARVLLVVGGGVAAEFGDRG